MQPDDATGIVSEMRELRDAIERRLSSQAFRRAFPTLANQPIPKGRTNRELHALQDRVADLEAEVAKLQNAKMVLAEANADLRQQLITAGSFPLRRYIPATHAPSVVINKFLDELNALRVPAGIEPLRRDDMESPQRCRRLAAPRHVCIYLVRRLSTHYSTPRIGRFFGNRDHTSIMHGINRAPVWLAEEPMLQAAADAVLRHFGIDEENAGGPAA